MPTLPGENHTNIGTDGGVIVSVERLLDLFDMFLCDCDGQLAVYLDPERCAHHVCGDFLERRSKGV